MRAIVLVCTLAATGVLLLAGCKTAPTSTEAKATQETEVQNTIRLAKTTDPGLQSFFDKSAGYAVFPNVGAGAYVVGGAYGKGQVFQNGQFIGYTSLTQANVGLQLGGQSYSELIFFQTPEVLDKFKTGNFSFTGEVSAVALTTGAAARTNFQNGVAVFTIKSTGLMFSAAVGGQKFSFQPAGTATASATATTPASSTISATQPAGAPR
jgi:lipid-binding SYLF domain-containing protein